jgi:hypothetical protein
LQSLCPPLYKGSRRHSCDWNCFNSDGVSNPSYSTKNIYCSQITRDTNTGDIVLAHEGLFDKGPPFVSGQPLTTDTATYDIIGCTYYVGFKSKF